MTRKWRPLQLAAVGCLAIAMLLLIVHTNEGGNSSPPPGLGYDAASFHCPSPRAVARRTGGGERALQHGATEAMICPPVGDRSWIAPNQRLTTGLAGLVDLVNASTPAASPGQNCVSSMESISYVLVLRYPDGVRTISGEPGLCDSLDFGHEFRSGASAVWQRYLRLLAAQRAYKRPTGSTERARCPMSPGTAAVSPLPQLASLRLGRLCRSGPRATWSGRGIAVPQRLLDAVRYDVRHRTQPRASSTRCEERQVRRIFYLAATDEWGDRVLFRIECAGVTLVRPDGNPVEPSALRPRARHLMETLVTRAATLKP
jgi:hypothetical protein